MTTEKRGRIVWHDLFTPDAERSKSFYQDVAHWSYLTEHATDFAWGGGEKDFTLALLDGEAGAGIIDQTPGPVVGWIPYVEVDDVDATAALAADHGGTIVKPPFEVPGVGRNCVLRDPHGAHIGISLSRHAFPAPKKQFAAERYLSSSGGFPATFYHRLFGWEVAEDLSISAKDRSIMLNGETLALCEGGDDASNTAPLWVPSLRVEDLLEALNRGRLAGATVLRPAKGTQQDARDTLLRDPTGGLFSLAVG